MKYVDNIQTIINNEYVNIPESEQYYSSTKELKVPNNKKQKLCSFPCAVCKFPCAVGLAYGCEGCPDT